MKSCNVSYAWADLPESPSTRAYGAALYIAEGTLTAEDVMIADCRAQAGGGVITIFAGRAVLKNSHILRAKERAMFLQGGELHLVNSTVNGSEVDFPNYGAIAYSFSARGSSVAPLLIATSCTFGQNSCNGPLFVSDGLLQLIMRDIKAFTLLDGCDPASFAAALADVTTKDCGDTYVSIDGTEFGVCSSRAPGACTAHTFSGTSLRSLHCECPEPFEYLNPNIADVEFAPYGAPYITDRGCIEPVRINRLVYEDERLVVALSKPGRKRRALNVSLELRGTDTQAIATWRLLNASSVPPWLTVPVKEEQIDTSSLSEAGELSLSIALVLSATGLRESALPYTQTIVIEVRSEDVNLEGNIPNLRGSRTIAEVCATLLSVTSIYQTDLYLLALSPNRWISCSLKVRTLIIWI